MGIEIIVNILRCAVPLDNQIQNQKGDNYNLKLKLCIVVSHKIARTSSFNII